MPTQQPTTTQLTDKADAAVSGFQQGAAREALVQWVMEHVLEWERWRKQNFDVRWRDYWRKWRGLWTPEDRTRGSERSRLISPALQQAVEEALAEIEEAVLGEKEGWFDLDDNRSDLDQEEWQPVRLQLLDDMDDVDAPGSLVEIALYGALYGTLLGKVVPDLGHAARLQMLVNPQTGDSLEGVQDEEKVRVSLEPIRPDQFVIDTAVNKPGRRGIEQALGMAHRLPRPRHWLRAKMQDTEVDDSGRVVMDATYFEVPLEGGESSVQTNDDLTKQLFGAAPSSDEDANLFTEYHGLVPKALLDAAVKDSDAPNEIDSREMVEAVVSIVDDKWLLAGRPNENLKRDRDIIAAPWDLIPGSFWGRGVAEKGFNAQKALDAQLRAQIDALGYTVHPMLGVNAQRRDPRHKIVVQPGQVIYTNGPPSDSLFPLNFGRMDPTTFTSSGELERLIQVATGTAGTFAPARGARSSGTASGMSMIRGDLGKRYKRTLRLIERHLLIPLIEKFTLRHMQYNEEVYPFVDLRFRVRTAMSLAAREVENGGLVDLLQTIPPGPVFYALVKQIVENTSSKDKGFVLQLIDSVIQQTMQQGGAAGEAGEEKPDEVDEVRKVVDLEEVVARTRQKQMATAKTAVEIQQITEGDDNTAESPARRKRGRERTRST